jgi:hypothetical protein
MAWKVVVVLITGIAFLGCGTIIHGTRQDIKITSDPADAEATVGHIKVRTPATVSLSRLKDQVVTVEKVGYETATVELIRRFNGIATILGNILWLVPGVIVDVFAGGAWTLEPEMVGVKLAPKK